MKKILNLSLLALGAIALLASCQGKSFTNDYKDEIVPNTSSENQEEDDPTTSEPCVVEFVCDSGCKVKESSDTSYLQHYVGTFDSNTDLTFQFSLLNTTNCPKIIFTRDNNVDTKTWTLNEEELTLTFNTSTTSKISIDAYTIVPAVEIMFQSEWSRPQVSVTYTGSYKFADFGGGQIVLPSSSASIGGTVAIDESTKKGSLKIYGNVNSILRIGGEDFDLSTITEIRFNQASSIRFDMFDRNMTNLKKIYVGPNVTSVIPSSHIDACAFRNLERIEVDPKNEYFDSREDCGNLIETNTNKIVIGGGKGFVPDTITSIGKGAYAGNSSFSFLRLPDSVKQIERQAFIGSSIAYFEISPGLEEIGDYAFEYCDCLSICDFSRIVKAPRMHANVFNHCELLSNDGVKNSHPFIHTNISIMGEIFNDLTEYDNEWKYNYSDCICTQIEDVPSFVCVCEVPQQETTISINAEVSGHGTEWNHRYNIYGGDTPTLFQDWEEGKPINYTASYDIDRPKSAFCVAIYSSEKGAQLPISINLSNTESFVANEDNENISFAKFYVNYKENRIGRASFANITSLRDFGFAKSIDDNGVEQWLSISEIREFAFMNCRSLHLSLNFPSGLGLSYIGESAFFGADVTSINIIEETSAIGRFAFANNPHLGTVNFSKINYKENLMLGDFAFAGAKNLSTIYIPQYVSLETHGQVNPFAGCTALTSLGCGADGYNWSYNEGENYLSYGDYAVCPTNSYNEATSTVDRISVGFETVSKSSTLTSYGSWDIDGNYGFAFSDAKTIKIHSTNFIFFDHDFYCCKNLKVIDLSSVGDVNIGKETTDLQIFEGVNPNFVIKVKTNLVGQLQGLLPHFVDHIVGV